MCAKSNGEPSSLLPMLRNKGNKSVLLVLWIRCWVGMIK